MKSKINYSKTGVNYNVLDPVKRLAQDAGKQTAKNFPEVAMSRGESAYVWEEEDCFRAFVIEGLGTKNLVADEMRKSYETIAQDTVAAIVNDIITVGAKPQVINAYFATGDPNWFADKERSAALVEGWAKACQMAGVTWGGGETPGLAGIINPETIDLAGSCIGIIEPKERLILGNKLTPGDAILLIESSGIHANGLSLARVVAEKIPDGYATKLPDGSMYGETLLIPTHIYVALIKALFEANIDIHYMVNITGHGFRKLMRADREFTYFINEVPSVPEIFNFIQENSGNSDEEMYANFNMGAGFAVYLPTDQIEKAQAIAAKHNLKSWNAGVIQGGPKQVIIEPKDITFKAETLGIR
ncbi:phosphoribosylformylglycinamidine cyclo-ligase [Candidatus Daviesbacteria bacterium]|nr:phosphoribosylformylglycinamidine cyclo-ligase [Candidatus Daviesbacteria bacterium]